MLTRLNDNYMHPNPDFTYRDSTQVDAGDNVLLRIKLFDVDPRACTRRTCSPTSILWRSRWKSLANSLLICLEAVILQDGLNLYKKTNELRARQLASAIKGVKKILEEYGLWRI